VLVSDTMIARASENSWSELLTSGSPSPSIDKGSLECFPSNVSNPAQHPQSWPVMVDLQRMRHVRRFCAEQLRLLHCDGIVSVSGRKIEGRSMAPRRLRRSFSGWIAQIIDSFVKRLAKPTSPTQQYGSQRMCPFCGLITPRSKRLCLECGKPLRAVQIERKDARQG
jgi:hypothetical protein